ncbi:BES1/BZR1 homolog protein 4 [Ziziphus jujuba]|uniref:Protein BZR1 homolog n=2 Tax=Ziziphus jujuba TaxID=326968 RepID=A0A6P3ZTA7_ZIZJJ|nr:BES1/BZR1 homolog protein 4 [Ziziphus jujuba]KAH7544585.1 hypothetical protein FEM48_Zijuj01G0001400 [Ziziphus jujuba var. spinosa]
MHSTPIFYFSDQDIYRINYDGSEHSGWLLLLLLGMAGGRSQSDKEKTKMRERQRRAITTNIFHGLRKHGGYPLSPRADINEVLRYLAMEAGWIVLPDGTTYRSISNFMKCCPVCGTATASASPTPTSSVVIGGGAGGGECSRTASPEGFTVEGHSVTATSLRGLPSLHASSRSSSSHQYANAPRPWSHYTHGGGFDSLLRNQSAISAPAPQQQHL